MSKAVVVPAYQRKRPPGSVAGFLPWPANKKAASTKHTEQTYDEDEEDGFHEEVYEEEEADVSDAPPPEQSASRAPLKPHVALSGSAGRGAGAGAGALPRTPGAAASEYSRLARASTATAAAPKYVPPPSRSPSQTQSQVSSEQAASSKGSTAKAMPGNSPAVKPIGAKHKPPSTPPPVHLYAANAAKKAPPSSSARPRPPPDGPEDEDASGLSLDTVSAPVDTPRKKLPPPLHNKSLVGAPKHPAPPKTSDESPKHPRKVADVPKASKAHAVVPPPKAAPLPRHPSSSPIVTPAEAAAAANPKSSHLPVAVGASQVESDIADRSQGGTDSASRPSESVNAPQPQQDRQPAPVVPAVAKHPVAEPMKTAGTLPSPRKTEPRKEVQKEEKLAVGDDIMSTVCLGGLCDMRVIDLLDWPSFFEDMLQDVEKECNKYGVVVRSWADRKAALATVFVRFGTAEEAQLCSQQMENRRFAGQKVTTKLHSQRVWQSLTGK